jgi:predicted nucleic acid-binding protein
MYLLDTNVISELRRPRPHGGVVAWMSSVEDKDLRLAAATIGEIQIGIERARDNDEAKAAEIEGWLEDILQAMTVLTMDAETFRLWARIMHRKQERLSEDAMIAATAIRHDLTVVTRNLRDFEAFEVRVFSPFDR